MAGSVIRFDSTADEQILDERVGKWPDDKMYAVGLPVFSDHNFSLLFSHVI